MRRMSEQAVVFTHEGVTVRAAQHGDSWRGELLNERGEVRDSFTYTRDGFPGAVIGALCFTGLGFAPQLAARLWLHTGEAPSTT